MHSFENKLNNNTFIPASQLTKVRNNIIQLLDTANSSTYNYDYRRQEDLSSVYPVESLDNEYNVANKLSERFYADHKAYTKEHAIETTNHSEKMVSAEIPVMHTRYCIRRELGMCKRESGRSAEKFKEPFYICSGKNKFRLHFNCADCGMTLFCKLH